MRNKFPRKGDSVKDSYLLSCGKPYRTGTVVKVEYINDDPYICVCWDDGSHLPSKEQMKDNPLVSYADYESIEYNSFFTQENCGNGRWDETNKVWLIEPTGDELPADHPESIKVKEWFEKIFK